MIIYFALPEVGIFYLLHLCQRIIALSINSGAYKVKYSVQVLAIDKGQMEAVDARTKLFSNNEAYYFTTS